MKVAKIKKGDTIGIICPSSPIEKSSPRFKELEQYFNILGLKVKYGKTVGEKFGYLSARDQVRVDDIEEMFLNDEIDAILCMLGGYGTTRIVDKINYNIIANHPKLFIGFSDITVLLNAIYQKTLMPTIHGALGVYLGNPKFDNESRKDFESLLFSNQKNRILCSLNAQCETINAGTASGIIVGGNLTLIASLMGTPYEIDFKDKIVLIEEVKEAPYRIDRYLSNLQLSGKLEEAAGFIFGTFTDCIEDELGWETIDVIKDYMDRFKKPAVFNFSSGHSFPFTNIPIGLNAILDAKNLTLTICEELYN